MSYGVSKYVTVGLSNSAKPRNDILIPQITYLISLMTTDVFSSLLGWIVPFYGRHMEVSVRLVKLQVQL